jgi:hypothetical protein
MYTRAIGNNPVRSLILSFMYVGAGTGEACNLKQPRGVDKINKQASKSWFLMPKTGNTEAYQRANEM